MAEKKKEKVESAKAEEVAVVKNEPKEPQTEDFVRVVKLGKASKATAIKLPPIR